MLMWGTLILGGISGTLARYLLSRFIYGLAGTGFPYGTMAVNLAGCFLVGIFAVLAEEKFVLGPEARMLLMVGFCGAFTTFSTFMLETANLMKDGQNIRAMGNVLLSVLLGFGALRLGIAIARII